MLGNGELSVAATVIAAIAVIFIFVWGRKNRKNVDKRYPPSAPLLPLIYAIIRRGMSALPHHFMKSAENLGPVISYKFGGRLVIILNGKKAITDAFLKKSEAFADRNELWTEKNLLNRNLKGVLFARYNDSFKKHHKLCLTILKEFGFGDSSVSETRILRQVESMNNSILKFNGRPFNPKLLTVYSTFNVVSTFLFGDTFTMSDTNNRISESVIAYVKHFDFAFDIAPFLRFLPIFRKNMSIMVENHEAILSGIEEGIEHCKSIECESTFVRRFIEIQGPDYDRQDLLYTVRDLCFGSSDTVSTTLQWAMVELANNLDVQTRFQREIDDVVSKDRFPSLDDKPRLPYTEAVILEVMRRHTVSPLYLPHATLTDTNVLGHYVPEGSMVIANALSTHMNPQFWKDPEKFRPERFLDEDNTISGSENVISFGLGKRSCLGEILGRQKTFLFLVSLVQRFNILPPEGQNSVIVKEIIGAVLHPSEFEVRLIPRTQMKN